MPYINISEDVWVDLDAFETEDLIEELKERKSLPAQARDSIELVNEIYLAKHIRNQKYDHLVDELIHSVLGKIV